MPEYLKQMPFFGFSCAIAMRGGWNKRSFWSKQSKLGVEQIRLSRESTLCLPRA